VCKPVPPAVHLPAAQQRAGDVLPSCDGDSREGVDDGHYTTSIGELVISNGFCVAVAQAPVACTAPTLHCTKWGKDGTGREASCADVNNGGVVHSCKEPNSARRLVVTEESAGQSVAQSPIVGIAPTIRCAVHKNRTGVKLSNRKPYDKLVANQRDGSVCVCRAPSQAQVSCGPQTIPQAPACRISPALHAPRGQQGAGM